MRRLRPRRRRLTRVQLWLVVAVLAAACAGGARAFLAPPPDLDLLDGQEVMQEYVAETAHLTLPSGGEWAIDSTRALIGADDPNHHFERGVGAQTAQLEWYCSWATVAISGSSQRDAALLELPRIEHMSVWVTMDANGHRLHRAIHDRVARGDVAPMREYVATNCGEGEEGDMY